LVNEGYLKENPVQPVSGEGNYTVTPDASEKNKITIAPGRCDAAGEPRDTEEFYF